MFFTKYVEKMLLITGIGTSAALAYAFFPQWAVNNIGQLPYLEQDFVFYQHWGIMVGMMGVMMIGAASSPNGAKVLCSTQRLRRGLWCCCLLPILAIHISMDLF